MKLTTILSLSALFWAMPANACEMVPAPLVFAERTAALSDESKSALKRYANIRAETRQNRVLVIFYGGVPTRKADSSSLNKQQQAVRDYLIGEGVPTPDISIVTTRRAMPAWLVELAGRKQSRATVELTKGCG